jgi:UDP-N-acetylglucosamine 2-epimerase
MARVVNGLEDETQAKPLKVQEEAPSLGKPVIVLREKTERPEARWRIHNPYGNGHASGRMATFIGTYLAHAPRYT